ncbi:hypothetical protein FRC01_012300 [Tulasnella sp. 417]|nr:hypothetical protein FRC01_012300 [Tulasnella sp. 417]
MTAEGSPEKPVLAYLGPEGTYTHQAANDYFAESVSYISCQTIASAFHALGSSADIAFLPIENSTHGAVIETLDLLRLASSENQFIRGEALAAINHCLVARKGTKWENIQTVVSHEQNIQDSAANGTRFIILSAPNTSLPPSTASSLLSGQPQWCAMLRITPPPAHSLNLGDVFGVIQPLAIARADRRPSLSPTPFQDTYFVTVRDGGTYTDLEWKAAVNAAAGRLLTKLPRGETDCSVLGIWKA